LIEERVFAHVDTALATAGYLYKIAHFPSLVADSKLSGGRDIGFPLLDVRLAIRSVQKTAAANLASFACCVPAFFNGSPIGFRFLNVTWNKILHEFNPSLLPGSGAP
jgi:hypothetical protein